MLSFVIPAMKRYETLVGLYQVKVFCNVATFLFCLYYHRKNFMFMFTSLKKIKIVDCIIIDNTIMKKNLKETPKVESFCKFWHYK